MRSPKDSSRQFDRFRSYVSDHLTLSILLGLAVAATVPAVLAGVTFGRERDGVATAVERRVFVEPATQPLGAAVTTFTVNSLGDASDTNTADNLCDSDAAPNEQCTLRAAIQQANATAGTDTITFNLPGAGPHTIQLAGALPNLSDSVDILNTSGESVTVRRDTGGNYGVFTINSGQTVNINGLTISNGFAPNGGGIFNSGTLNVTNSAVSNGFSISGGGIYNNGGTVTLTNSAVSNNNGSSGSGGIYNDGGTLNVTDSTVSGNSSNSGGGGIYNLSGTATLTNSAFSNNSGGSGGGIYNNDGTVTLTNCTVSGNSATFGAGGGIINVNVGTLNLTNSTVSGNSAGLDGGGIYTDGGNATLTGVTITNNRADSDNNGEGTGGGIYIQSGTPLLRSTIVAGNFNEDGATDSADDINNGTVDAASSYNLIGTGGAGGINTDAAHHNQVGVADPRLGPLANNGGPTQTHHLLAGSPAIDKGDDFSASATTDQRGLLRPFDDPTITNEGDGTDIGAYEVQDTGAVQSTSPFVVNTTGDHDDGAGGCTTGDCTLREAILAANAAAGADTITFNLPGAGPHTIQLAGELPNLTDSVDILNTSGESVTVRRNTGGVYGIFGVNSGKTVNINGLTITNGAGGGGGGIYNDGGTLTLTNCTVSGNFSSLKGGGIYNSGTLTLTESTVSGNSAIGGSSEGGGGIYNIGTLNVTSSIVSGNSVTNGNGSGIYNSPSGTLTLTSSIVSGNSVSNNGGGIYNIGTLNVTNSTVSGNAAFTGGGIYNSVGTATLTNSTVSGNTAKFQGGGIFHGSGNATLTGVTITANRADSDNNGTGTGGGIYIQTGTPLLRSTIVAGNFNEDGATDSADDIKNGTVDAASSYNLIGTGGAGGINTDAAHHNQVGVVDPGLLPLANNGGPTQTHAVLSTSPAIDKGNAFGSTTDQRGVGFPRVVGAAADVGAVEGPDIDPPTVTINQPFTQADPTNVSPVNFTVVFSEPVADFATGDVTLSGTAGATTANVTGSGTTYNVAVSGMTANGTIVATILAGKATDASGNPNAASTSTDNTVTFTGFPAAITATAGTPQSATINTAFATALQATVTDGSGTPVSGVNVTFTAPASGESGTFANGTTTTTATTNASGVATATTFTANSSVGSYSVTASASGGTLSTSFSLTNTSPANVSGTKTVSGTFNEGNTVTYTIVLSNSGPAAQLDNPGNEFTDVLPSQLTLVSASATSGTATTGANTVNWNGSILAGGSVTITITATINDVPDGTIVSNQGTISYDADGNGTNEASRLTDDPSVGGTSDPTSFAAVSKSDLTITKSHSGNFSGGQMGASYTITVNNIGTGVTSGLVTVTDTVPVGLTPTGPNGVVNGWTCAINGQTVTCTRSDTLADGASYPAINLTVNVANPAPLNVVNTATVAGGGEVNTANNTASDSTAINCSANFGLNNTSPLMISRFRENGPAGPQDEFVEIYNPSPIPHTVASGNCNGGGYGVYASSGNGTTSNTATLVCYIPNGTVIPAGGYYLCTGATYSLNNLGLNGGAAGATATGDAPIGCGGTCGADIPNDAGLVLTNKAEPTVTTPENFGVVEFGEVIYDKVGFGPYGPAAPAPGYPTFASIYCEGGAAGCLKPVGDGSTGVACTNPSGQFPVVSVPPACYGLSGQYEFLRRQTTFSATDGTIHQDTNNSGNDFILVAPNPAMNMGQTITGVAGVTAVLGAARPYNRNAPPDLPAVKLTRSPFDGADQLGPRNLERRFIPDPTIADPANNPLGTLTLRFKFTNNSGLPINGIRFSVDNLSTLCGPQVAAPTTASVGTGDARNVGSTPGCGTGSFTAIFKALNSTAETLVDGGGTAQFVNGTVMEDLSVGQSPTPPGAGPLSPKGGGIDSTFIINPSSNTATVGDGVTGGVGNFATVIGSTDPTKVIRVRVKFGVVRSGRFILLLVPMAKNSPAP